MAVDWKKALAGMKTGLAGLGTAFAGAIDPMMVWASNGTKAATAMAGLGSVLNAKVLGPISLLSGAIYGVVAAFKILLRNSEMLREGMEKLKEIEFTTTQFAGLIGGAERAKARVKDLYEFAASTPFQIGDIAQASKMLEVLTKGALSTGESLRMIGDAAAVSGSDLSNVSLHVGRLYDGLKSGRPIGESSARLQELGLISGKVRKQLQDAAKDGMSFSKSWEILTKELESNKGGMEALSQTLQGLETTLSDTQAQMKAGFAKNFLEAEKESMRRSIEVAKAMSAPLEEIGKWFGYVSAAGEKMSSFFIQAAGGAQNLGSVLKGMVTAFIYFASAVAAAQLTVMIIGLSQAAIGLTKFGVATALSTGFTTLRTAGLWACVKSMGAMTLAEKAQTIAMLFAVGVWKLAAMVVGVFTSAIRAATAAIFANPFTAIAAAVAVFVVWLWNMNEALKADLKAAMDLREANNQLRDSMDDAASAVTNMAEAAEHQEKMLANLREAIIKLAAIKEKYKEGDAGEHELRAAESAVEDMAVAADNYNQKSTQGIQLNEKHVEILKQQVALAKALADIEFEFSMDMAGPAEQLNLLEDRITQKEVELKVSADTREAIAELENLEAELTKFKAAETAVGSKKIAEDTGKFFDGIQTAPILDEDKEGQARQIAEMAEGIRLGETREEILARTTAVADSVMPTTGKQYFGRGLTGSEAALNLPGLGDQSGVGLHAGVGGDEALFDSMLDAMKNLAPDDKDRNQILKDIVAGNKYEGGWGETVGTDDDFDREGIRKRLQESIQTKGTTGISATKIEDKERELSEKKGRMSVQYDADGNAKKLVQRSGELGELAAILNTLEDKGNNLRADGIKLLRKRKEFLEEEAEKHNEIAKEVEKRRNQEEKLRDTLRTSAEIRRADLKYADAVRGLTKETTENEKAKLDAEIDMANEKIKAIDRGPEGESERRAEGELEKAKNKKAVLDQLDKDLQAGRASQQDTIVEKAMKTLVGDAAAEQAVRAGRDPAEVAAARQEAEDSVKTLDELNARFGTASDPEGGTGIFAKQVQDILGVEFGDTARGVAESAAAASDAAFVDVSNKESALADEKTKSGKQGLEDQKEDAKQARDDINILAAKLFRRLGEDIEMALKDANNEAQILRGNFSTALAGMRDLQKQQDATTYERRVEELRERGVDKEPAEATALGEQNQRAAARLTEVSTKKIIQGKDMELERQKLAQRTGQLVGMGGGRGLGGVGVGGIDRGREGVDQGAARRMVTMLEDKAFLQDKFRSALGDASGPEAEQKAMETARMALMSKKMSEVPEVKTIANSFRRIGAGGMATSTDPMEIYARKQLEAQRAMVALLQEQSMLLTGEREVLDNMKMALN